MKIDGSKIKKYVALGMVTGVLAAGFIIEENCAITNHTIDTCLKSEILNIGVIKEDGTSRGMQHRLDEIKKKTNVVDAYYGDILNDKYEYISAIEYRNGSEITYVAPNGYCLEGTLCRSIEPVGQVKLGTGIIVTYKSGLVKKIILNSDNDLTIGRIIDSSPTNFKYKNLVKMATYVETIDYTEPAINYDGQYVDSRGGKIVEKDGKKLFEHRTLTLKK